MQAEADLLSAEIMRLRGAISSALKPTPPPPPEAVADGRAFLLARQKDVLRVAEGAAWRRPEGRSQAAQGRPVEPLVARAQDEARGCPRPEPAAHVLQERRVKGRHLWPGTAPQAAEFEAAFSAA